MPFTFNFGGFNPGDFGQGGERPQRERKPRKPIGTPVTRTLINIAVTALVGLVYFYVELPALNPHAGGILLLCVPAVRRVLRLRCPDLRIPGHRRERVSRLCEKAVHHTLLRGDRHDRSHRHWLPFLLGGAAGRCLQQAAALDHR